MAPAQMIQIELLRSDAQPWGFRLQGGVDFAAPLLVQKVNSGSFAEKAGLSPGDEVIKINDVDVFNLRHKEAQDIIVRSGNNFTVTIQRGGSTWRPHVSPIGNLPSPNQNSSSTQAVTKTSLAHKPQDAQHIGCGYNNSARPFINGGEGSVKSIINRQYNTPVGIYSDESIAETLSAQAEVLAGGVLGVNFKKNEKEYQADKSEVLRFLREEETGEHTPAFNSHHSYRDSRHFQQKQQHHQHLQHHQHQSPQQPSITKHVSAPTNTNKPLNNAGPQVSQNICYECDRLINGVFVRIKDKNLHVECFKCATCGTSLKNQGYYNFNNKLYCDIHAKLAALQNPPNDVEGYVPVPIKSDTKFSVSTISSALNAHGYTNSTSNGGSPASVPVGQGCARPYGASTSPIPPIKSPITSYGSTYPQQHQQQLKPAASPVATLPCNSISQKGLSTLKSPAVQLQSVGSSNPATLIANGNGTRQTKVGASPRSGGKPQATSASFGATSAPRRGRGVFNKAVGPGARVPLCNSCQMQIRGPFITALGRIWCPDHFICVNGNCRHPLQDIGFVEEKGDLYCEYCFERYLAPLCSTCGVKIKGDCLNAIGKHFHPECFTCAHCGKLFGNTPFFLEEGKAYCEADWNEHFTTKCFACGFPVEAGDRWVEALNHNYHSQCFNCTFCKQNLEGQNFYNKGGRPFCKNHAR